MTRPPLLAPVELLACADEPPERRLAGIGPNGTEFGGLPTTAGSDTFYAPAARAYARIAFYF